MPDKGTHMSADAYLAQARGEMSWREWEKTFDGILREGGWSWWADRVVPASRIRSLLYHYGVPKRVVDRVVGMIQSLGRIPGLPDRVVVKKIDSVMLLSVELDALTGNTLSRHSFPLSTIGFIELKTGKAKPTKEQAWWLRIVAMCPGCFAAVGRPEHIDYWRKVLVF